MKQIYENYTKEDQQVWEILFTRQIKNLKSKASESFFIGLNEIEFTSQSIPNFNQTNEILEQKSGWQLEAVPGIVEDKVFFELLSVRKFPATTWLRGMKQLDYLEEPDMFHDVFAHAPLLTNVAYVKFLEELSKIALEFIENPIAIDLLTRIYWYTIEFGLIKENNLNKIYGAGILSSTGESNYSVSSQRRHFSYNVNGILLSDYKKDSFQEKYFLINDYKQLFNSIAEIKVGLTNMLADQITLESN